MRFRRGMFCLVGWVALVGVGCSSGAEKGETDEESVADALGFCATYESRLRECNVLGEGRFEGCFDVHDDAELCETQCWASASCDEVRDYVCAIEVTSLPPVANCLDACVGYEFRCGDGEVVSEFRKCDGIEDCADGADERNCDGFALSGFACRNTEQRVSFEQACDGVADCGDGSDELFCNVVAECETTVGTFEVLDFMYCDGREDCTDGSDEPEGCARLIACE